MAESIKDKVSIVGMGCTKFGENWEWSVEDMVVDAVYEAYEDARHWPRRNRGSLGGHGILRGWRLDPQRYFETP